MEEQNEINKLNSERQKKFEKAAYQQMIFLGEEYLRQKGIIQLDRDIKMIRAYLTSWNRITGSSVPFNLNTIDVALARVANIPTSVGVPEMAVKNIQFIDLYSSLSAVRNNLIAERNTKLNAILPPDLSTS